MHVPFKIAVFACSLGVCAISGANAAIPSAAAAPARSAEPVLKLDPLTVSAVFPAIRVRFVLSRQNLFDPLGDPIEEARVVWVEAEAGGNADSGIRTADVLLSVNGTELRGLTLRQIAALVAEARQSKTVLWEIRRGLSTLVVRHNGKWEVPLPGLQR